MTAWEWARVIAGSVAVLVVAAVGTYLVRSLKRWGKP